MDNSNKALRKIISEVITEELKKQNNIIVPPIFPNSMNFWHGGNLNDYNDIIAQKNGRYEFGPGLYATTHYDTAVKYAKGSRKLYLLTVENGTDIHDAILNIDVVKDFIKNFVIGSKRKEIWLRMKKYVSNDTLKAYLFNNIILNEKAIKASNSKDLREFYVNNGIDYEIIDNAFGWHEKMIVLYNMDKLINIIQIKPTDQISVYDLS